MIRKTLGNLLLLLLLMPYTAQAWVNMTAPKSIMRTQTLEFRIVAKGFHVQFPAIQYIEGFRVQNIKSSREAVLIDTKKADKVTKIYTITPTKSITLPSFSIKIDGKIEKTRPLHVTLKELTQTRSDNYKLSMDINSKTPMVGEKLTLHVKLTYKDLADYEVVTPEFIGFSLKEKSDDEYKNAKGEWVEELSYELTAQKSGNFILHPVKAKIELRHPKYKKQEIYSNALKISVAQIPQHLNVAGRYMLQANVNTRVVEKNKPVLYTLTLQGSGNINNFDDINISIPDAVIYDQGVKIVHRKDEDIYQKSFEIVSDKDFTIPCVSLEYFDTAKQKIQKIYTQSFAVRVKGSMPAKKSMQKEKITLMEKILYFMLGVLVTLLLSYIYKVLKNTKTTDKQKILKKELQRIRSKEAFFKRVVVFLGRDKSLNRLIYALENADDTEYKKLKKEIITLLDKADDL